MRCGNAWDGGHLGKLEAEYLAANPNVSRRCPTCKGREPVFPPSTLNVRHPCRTCGGTGVEKKK
jgi:DnaJ-class molecular chaperone